MPPSSTLKPVLSGPALVYYGPIPVSVATTGSTTVGLLPDGANRLIVLDARLVVQGLNGNLGTAPVVVLETRTNGQVVGSSLTLTAAAADRQFPFVIPSNGYTLTNSETQSLTVRTTTANGGVATTFRARTDNIATLTTATHNLSPGDTVTIVGVGGTGYNQENAVVISVPSSTTFTYYSEGADEASTADTGGAVTGLGDLLFYATALLV